MAKKSVQGQTTEMFKKVTIKFDGLKNANTFNIYAICSSSRLSTGDPRNQDIFLQKTAFSLVISRLALGSPGWFGQAKDGRRTTIRWSDIHIWKCGIVISCFTADKTTTYSVLLRISWLTLEGDIFSLLFWHRSKIRTKCSFVN